MMGLPTAVVTTVMAVTSTVVLALAYVIYRCQRDAVEPVKYSNIDPSTSETEDDSAAYAEEDHLMIPMDRDTILDLKRQLSQINVANVRYIQIGTVEKDFSVRQGVEPRNYFEGDTITFRDIAMGFMECIPDVMEEESRMKKRTFIIFTFCEKQLRCSHIGELSQIIDVVVYLCKLVIKLKYNKSKEVQYVMMRDLEMEEFKADLLTIAEWVWNIRMKAGMMKIEDFARGLNEWIHEVESNNVKYQALP